MRNTIARFTIALVCSRAAAASFSFESPTILAQSQRFDVQQCKQEAQDKFTREERQCHTWQNPQWCRNKKQETRDQEYRECDEKMQEWNQ